MNASLRMFVTGILNSYSQVFFARNQAFAIFLLIVTFFDPVMGFCGLFSIIISNLLAWYFGFSEEAIQAGDFGFNSLLVGLGLGFYYAPTIELVILVIVGAILTFIFTVTVSGFLYKYNLPFLSIPFLLALWALMLSSRNFTNMVISERGVYTLNELYITGSNWLVELYQLSKQGYIPEIIRIYFNSLGAILFQFNILSGILIAIGLLIYSRIAFLFSIVNFIAAYYFYQLLGADIKSLSYYYIGFNFILSGIAIGGYFLIPSRSSILWSIILVAVLMILTSSLGSLFVNWQLNIYSLPFNIVVISFLYVLKLRKNPREPKEVLIQHHSPEHNLYHNLSGKGRFKNFRPVTISLPVFGKWNINQAHNGRHTHRGEWKEAWDFVLKDENGSEHKGDGKFQEDYYCFGKPVIAPAEGKIEHVADDVEDNIIGDSNLQQNWGNSIVIKHDHNLYTQLSHLKKGSIKVKKGDNVKSGQVLAQCGNSGRSPEPHLHFQIQSTPYIGSKTLNYPLSHYLKENNGHSEFNFYDFPAENDNVRRIETDSNYAAAFHFLPGQVLSFEVSDDARSWKETWEVKTDYYNNSYLECQNSGSKAYFNNDQTLFYFTQFAGDKASLLYYFFLGAFRVLLSSEEHLELTDEVPLHLYINARKRFIHDFIAPVFPYLRAEYKLKYGPKSSAIGEENSYFNSMVTLKGPRTFNKKLQFDVTISSYRISEINIRSSKLNLKAKCTDS